MKTKDVEKKLRHKHKKESQTSKDFLSTGSTLLNLACTGHPLRGFAKGKYHLIVGDSTSGKTFLSLTCLAEASYSKRFSNYRFIYDNGEDGALMDITKFFGKRVAKRMEAPAMEGRHPVYSSTIEEFYYNVDDAINTGKPFIYILDSMDVLSSKEEASKFDEHKKAHRKQRQAKGSFTDGKAKNNSTKLRRVVSALKKTESILIIISQTRDNIGFGFEPKARSGGHALRFYATAEFWCSVKGQINKTVRGKKRQQGIIAKIKMKKTRFTGQLHTIEIPIYHSFGIDDIGSCVDWLMDEDYWEEKNGKINAVEFGKFCKKEKLIQYIEQEGMEKDLRSIVGEVWHEIEKACSVKRKKRYE